MRLVQLRAAVRDKGHALLRQVGDALVERFRAPDDQAVDAAALDHAFIGGKFLAGRGGGDDHVHLLRFQRFGHAAHDLDEHGVGQVVGHQRVDDADDIRASHGQAARHGIGPVAGRLRGGQHPFARAFTHFRIAIQGAADGGFGNS